VTDWQGGTLIHENIVFDAPKSGYVLRFHAGPAAVQQDGTPVPQLVSSYAVSAVPVSASTGVRHFCAESSGLIYIMPQGAVPTEASCPGEVIR
jgi:hypothetical protein